MSEMIFNLPDVGEGLTEADLVTWLVQPGDTVELNQIVCEIETAKSLVEIPTPYAGTVTELCAEPGQTVPVGEPLLKVTAEGVVAGQPGSETPGSGADAAARAEKSVSELAAVDSAASQAEPGKPAVVEEEGSGAVLVGYGSTGAVKSRRRKGGEPLLTQPEIPTQTGKVVAKPPVRKLAKDLGVNLQTVSGTGKSGEILRDDVTRIAGSTPAPLLVTGTNNTSILDDAEREKRLPVKGIRKQIAKAMVDSKFTAPHVSVFTEIDATRTMEYVQRLKASRDFQDVKVSPLLIMAKAIIWAIRRNPIVNAWFAGEEIIVPNYVNLGIAAATPRGLLVPNIKDAEKLSMLELAKAIGDLTITAREGKTTPADMAGGTITITNIGVFGVDTGTPILNPGEASIIAMGAIKKKPWVVDGEIVPRWVTTVGGSFDHRVIDGDVISRFIADIASILEEPALLLD